MPTTTLQGKTLSTVELNWKEVFYTNCGMVSASNVDQELSWCKTDFAAIGVDYSYFRSRREIAAVRRQPCAMTAIAPSPIAMRAA